MSSFAIHAALLLGAGAAAPAGGRDPYPVGETLEYRVKLIGISGGAATMSVVAREELQGRPVARLRLAMRSNRFVSRFYPLDNTATSTIDAGTGESLNFRFDKNERNRREVQEFTVDPEKRLARCLRRKHSGAEEAREVALAGPVQDPLSVFYRLRGLPLELGTFENLTVLDKDRTYPIRFAADGLERVSVPDVGVFWAIVVRPTAGMPGLFSEEGNATLWLEATTRVMLRMVVEAPKGSASMSLVRAQDSALLDAPGSFRRRE